MEMLRSEFFALIVQKEKLITKASALQTEYFEDAQFSGDIEREKMCWNQYKAALTKIEGYNKRMAEIRLLVGPKILRVWRKEWKKSSKKVKCS